MLGEIADLVCETERMRALLLHNMNQKRLMLLCFRALVAHVRVKIAPRGAEDGHQSAFSRAHTSNQMALNSTQPTGPPTIVQGTIQQKTRGPKLKNPFPGLHPPSIRGLQGPPAAPGANFYLPIQLLVSLFLLI